MVLALHFMPRGKFIFSILFLPCNPSSHHTDNLNTRCQSVWWPFPDVFKWITFEIKSTLRVPIPLLFQPLLVNFYSQTSQALLGPNILGLSRHFSSVLGNFRPSPFHSMASNTRRTRRTGGVPETDYCNECGTYHQVPVAQESPIFAEKSKKAKSKSHRQGSPSPTRDPPPMSADPEMKAIMMSMASSLDQLLKNTAVQQPDRRRSTSAPPGRRGGANGSGDPNDPKDDPSDPKGHSFKMHTVLGNF